jgi:alpha-galactosidase
LDRAHCHPLELQSLADAARHIISTDNFSFVVEITTENDLVWRHWGARIAGPLAPLASTETPTTFSLNPGVPMGVVPTSGFGWFGPPGIRCHRRGRHAGQRLKVRSATASATTFDVVLIDENCGIEVGVVIAPQGRCLRIATRLRNVGDTPLSVDALAAAVLPLPPHANAIISFGGRHNGEMVEHNEPMPAQGWYRAQRAGLTGHGGPPGLFVLGEGTDWHHGEVWAAQLAWSGNHRLLVEPTEGRGWVALLGADYDPGEIVLAPGEELSAPEVLTSYADNGRNGAIGAFHDAIRAGRRAAGAAPTPRPVHFNSWESVYFDHDEPRMIALVESAAALGVERFVLDDGWFRGRASDRAGLGDWVADPLRYPRGLGPVARRVNALGMTFGLWVEPEMVNPDSDLYRQHPDWVLGATEAAPLPLSRHQLVLDMARDDVRAHLFAALSTLLREHPIAYLKWDHNRALAPISGADGRGSATAQVRGTWTLWDRLRVAFPHVEMESCAAGGGRVDAGFAARADRFWTSDNIDAVSRIAIQRNFLHFMPPEMMGAHVGASPSHATGRTQSLDFRAMVALPGHFGIELAPARLTADERERLAAWVARYKALRDRLHNGATWLGRGSDGLLWQAHGTADHFLLLVTRTQPSRSGRESPLRLPMVADLPQVVIRVLNQADRYPSDRAIYTDANGAPCVPGSWLAAHGLPLPRLSGEGAVLFEIVAIA